MSAPDGGDTEVLYGDGGGAADSVLENVLGDELDGNVEVEVIVAVEDMVMDQEKARWGSDSRR